MSLFQTSVIKKYLSDLSSELIDKKYNEFQSYFGNPERQENIRNLKEEEFQEGFIRELFVKIFGYTLNPEPNFNIVLEKKNVDDSKKADGAIIRNNEVIAVIELKSTHTTNLDSFRDQAFGYKNHNPKCAYVITSNFEKIRLYIHDTTNHEEFDLFNLTKDRFALLWLCFSKDNILNDIPLNIKEASVLQEENVTKKLYNDYSKFREEIFNDIVKNNPEFDKLVLFKKTQKLLDRFLFIFFAEDRLLLPPNSISEIVKQWVTLKEDLDEYVPLYDRFKKYFGYLNTGFKGKKYDIFAYNGGLFLPDEILDNIKIDDEILREHTVQLSTYDFETDVDVNILGHIFEHSLGEIENVQAEIAGNEVDSQKTKRKKDGIFYTPKYITKYIVENTVGKLCEEKRAEFGVIDEEYAKGRRNRKKEIVKDLDNKLTEYREWLLNITILDPACGSGAFLNQALEFLIEEHKKIDELKAQLLGGSIVFSDIEAKILEKNIYGVDLNEESVEIAKLSLWLRTAQKGRKLTTLSNHIKCGNSLIDDPEIAGEKAFNWHKEFSEVFANGGFDVVIGNPPYVNVELMPVHEKEFYKSHYKSFYKRSDLFSLFLDLATEKLSENGRISFIIPSIVLNNLSYKLIRERLLENNWLEKVCYTGGKVFADATVDTTILVIDKGCNHTEIELIDAINFFEQKAHLVSLDYFSKYDNNISIGQGESNQITDKIFREENLIADDYFQIFQGVVTGNNDAFIFENFEEAKEKGIDSELLHPMCHGRDISKWHIKNKHVLCYVDSNTEIENYKNTQSWLSQFKTVLETRRECRNGVIPWFSLQWSREKESFLKKPKILIQNTRNERLQPRIVATIDTEGLFGTQGLNFIIQTADVSIYGFLALLNSKLINYLFTTKFLNLAIKAEYLKKLKFPESIKNTNLEVLANDLSNLKQEHFNLTTHFQNLLLSKFEMDKLSKKLQSWDNLDFKDFLKELKKVKVQLNLSQESEWLQFFEEQKNKANRINSAIEKIETEINQIVYQLYNLTEEEIKIVENS